MKGRLFSLLWVPFFLSFSRILVPVTTSPYYNIHLFFFFWNIAIRYQHALGSLSFLGKILFDPTFYLPTALFLLL